MYIKRSLRYLLVAGFSTLLLFSPLSLFKVAAQSSSSNSSMSSSSSSSNSSSAPLSYPIDVNINVNSSSDSSSSSSQIMTEFTGKVTAVNQDQLSVLTGNVTKTLTVDSTVDIYKNGNKVNFSDIKVNDDVKIQLDSDNQPTRIDILTSNILADNASSTFIIAAIIILALLLGLILALGSRNNANRDSTKTTV